MTVAPSFKVVDLAQRRMRKLVESRMEQLRTYGLCMECEKRIDRFSPEYRWYFDDGDGLCLNCAVCEYPELCEGLCSVCGRFESSYPVACVAPRGYKCPQESDKEYRRIMRQRQRPAIRSVPDRASG